MLSGIADNAGFRSMLEKNHIGIAGFSDFPDHHPYTAAELDSVWGSALAANADLLFTTEKDFVRIRHRHTWPLDLIVMDVEIAFEDNAFDLFIRNRLDRVVEGNDGGAPAAGFRGSVPE